jgi:TorA maturation chaperone TorD
MFIYSDFKTLVLDADFDKAKAMLSDVELDVETFNALSNVSMFLSLAFRYPEDDVYDTISDNWDAFKDFLNDYAESKPELYEQTAMESDYIKLFEQDIEGNKVVPYISFYTEENKMLYGESTFKIREWMAEEGYAIEEDVTELEDHIYIVLEFISLVFKKLGNPENIEKWYASLRNLYMLLDNYGPVLTDEFATAVAKRDDMPFYRDFAKIMASFMKDIDPILEDVFLGGE